MKEFNALLYIECIFGMSIPVCLLQGQDLDVNLEIYSLPLPDDHNCIFIVPRGMSSSSVLIVQKQFRSRDRCQSLMVSSVLESHNECSSQMLQSNMVKYVTTYVQELKSQSCIHSYFIHSFMILISWEIVCILVCCKCSR